MRLTKKKAIDISIELWEWTAETGSEYKGEWPGWDKYGGMLFDCPLCQHYRKSLFNECGKCPFAPLGTQGDVGCYKTYYKYWEDAETKEGRQKYARLFLKQLQALK